MKWTIRDNSGAMHSDIEKAIGLIDQRIQALQNIRGQLIQEFGGAETGTVARQQTAPTAPMPSKPRASDQRRNGSTRKEQVAEFIRQNGPTSRAKIIEGTSIPTGTIAYCLNDKTRFRQLKDGKWDLANRGD